MKKERKALTVSLMVNAIVALLKICGGCAFHSYTLIACGIYTLIDFSTDLIAIVRSSIRHKRANKRYLFGIGRFEYYIHLIFGVIILLIGTFIFARSFYLDFKLMGSKVIWIPIISIIIKLILTIYLKKKGNEISSKIIMANSKESFLDMFITFLTLIMLLLAKNDILYDKLGCILMAIVILLYAIDMINNCIFLLTGTDKTDKKTKNMIKKEINKNEDVAYSDCFLMKRGNITQCIIELGVSPKVSFIKLLYLEEHIKHAIKKNNKQIKYIDYELIKK